mmetsp:Transcript_27456/g.73235  ORF Transcript_27456/g.73235 Transcript_27456/m.73235 type:complete len:271 (+) Transcript_27456:357-1169(+)
MQNISITAGSTDERPAAVPLTGVGGFPFFVRAMRTQHVIRDRPTEITVRSCAVCVAVDCHLRLLHCVRGGTSRGDGAPPGDEALLTDSDVLSWQACYTDAIVQGCVVFQFHQGKVVRRLARVIEGVRMHCFHRQRLLGRVCGVLTVAARHDDKRAPHTVGRCQDPVRRDECPSAKVPPARARRQGDLPLPLALGCVLPPDDAPAGCLHSGPTLCAAREGRWCRCWRCHWPENARRPPPPATSAQGAATPPPPPPSAAVAAYGKWRWCWRT